MPNHITALGSTVSLAMQTFSPPGNSEFICREVSNRSSAPGNLLFFGDNLSVISELLHSYRGKINLIYIDPPFDSGIDRSASLPSLSQKDTQAARETIRVHAYKDKWGLNGDSYLKMLRDRVALMYELLSDSGSLYLHCDYRASAHLKLILDEIFGAENYINECIWFYKTGGVPQRLGFGRKHDTIHFVVKNRDRAIWNAQKERSYLSHRYGFKNVEVHEDERGPYTLVNARDVWDIPALRGNQPERVDYPTQKPEALLERIILASSNPGDLVADFFCGSGTSGVVASRLGRRWIMADQGDLAIHTTRKRLLAAKLPFKMLRQKEIKAGDRTKIRIQKDLNNFTLYLESHENTDLWAIDFNYSSSDSFSYDWCSYRSKAAPSLSLSSPAQHSESGEIAVILADQSGNAEFIYFDLKHI